MKKIIYLRLRNIQNIFVLFYSVFAKDQQNWLVEHVTIIKNNLCHGNNHGNRKVNLSLMIGSCARQCN